MGLSKELKQRWIDAFHVGEPEYTYHRRELVTMRIRVGDTVVLDNGLEVVVMMIWIADGFGTQYYLDTKELSQDRFDRLQVAFNMNEQTIGSSYYRTIVSVKETSAIFQGSERKCSCARFDVVNFGCKCGGI